jgi:phosphatidylinositol alpha-1,6-mannosyltransferase
VVFAHGIDIWTPLGRPARWAIRRADLIICVSRFTADRAVRANGISPRKVRVLPNCLDPALALGATTERQESGPSLLTVGRLDLAEQYKGHDYVIRALPALLARFPGLTYDIVGDGDWRPVLQELAQQEGVAAAVRFHGRVLEAELGAHYARSTIFVMPSRGEGFGIVYLEAMSHAKPVIAGNQDASMEVVRDGETGLVVDPTNVSDLVRGIEQLLADGDLRRAMGERAAEAVSQRFSFDVFRRELLTRLSEILDWAPDPSRRPGDARCSER